MKDIERDLLGRLPVAGDSHGERENDAVRALVERMQRRLIARGDRLDEPHPVRLRHARLGPVGIQNLTQGAGRGPGVRLFGRRYRRHGGDFAKFRLAIASMPTITHWATNGLRQLQGRPVATGALQG